MKRSKPAPKKAQKAEPSPKAKPVTKKKYEDKPGQCFFHPVQNEEGSCSGEVEYCFGCKKEVCEGHSRNINLPFGGHDPYDHLQDEEEESDERQAATSFD